MRRWLRRLVCGGCFRVGIVPAHTHKCVNHAISVMRLALGYSCGLPEGWYWPGMLPARGRDFFQLAFPRHEVHLFVPDDAAGRFPSSEPFSQMRHYNPDEYLWAFAYKTERDHHFVIGLPAGLGAASVLAVSIEERR